MDAAELRQALIAGGAPSSTSEDAVTYAGRLKTGGLALIFLACSAAMVFAYSTCIERAASLASVATQTSKSAKTAAAAVWAAAAGMLLMTAVFSANGFGGATVLAGCGAWQAPGNGSTKALAAALLVTSVALIWVGVESIKPIGGKTVSSSAVGYVLIAAAAVSAAFLYLEINYAFHIIS